MSVNRVILLGFLGKNAELSYMPNGNPVLKASLATSERFKDKEGKYTERTEWTNLVAFGKRYEAVSKYMLKGTQVYVEGRLQTRQYEDKQGIKRSVTDIVLDNIVLLGGKSNDSHSPTQPTQFDKAIKEVTISHNTEVDEDCIPF